MNNKNEGESNPGANALWQKQEPLNWKEFSFAGQIGPWIHSKTAWFVHLKIFLKKIGLCSR